MKWNLISKVGVPKGEVCKPFLVCLQNNCITMYHYSSFSERWFSVVDGDECPENPVIAWMEIPEPPELLEKLE